MGTPDWLQKAVNRSKHPDVVQANQEEAATRARKALEDRVFKYLQLDPTWAVCEKFFEHGFIRVEVGREGKFGFPLSGEALAVHQNALSISHDSTHLDDLTIRTLGHVGHRIQGHLPQIKSTITVIYTVCVDKGGYLFTHLTIQNDGYGDEAYRATLVAPKNTRVVNSWLIAHVSGLVDGSLPVPPSAEELRRRGPRGGILGLIDDRRENEETRHYNKKHKR